MEEDAATFKEEASNIMSKVGFTLHKWHSNEERLNSVEKVMEGEETHAKSLVGNRGNGKNLRGSPAKSGPVHFASEKSFPLYFAH